MSVIDEYTGEPRTAEDFIRKLLEALESRTWTQTSEANCGRGCCGYRYFDACSSCGAEEGDYGKDGFRQHKEGCELEKLIRQSEAFLKAEDELREEKERGQALPHHPS